MRMNIASYIDHTILKPVTTHIEVKKICEEALQYSFAAICIPPPFVARAREFLAGGAVSAGPKVSTVIGFPFGYSVAKAKFAESEQAIGEGADELDVVINLVALREGNWSYLEQEMHTIHKLAHKQGRVLKVIIESGILTDEEIVRCCGIYGGMGVDYVKTSTGYAEKGASLHAVELMRKNLPASVKIKASGGIRGYAFARQLVEAGADRLGCSASVAIVAEEKERT